MAKIQNLKPLKSQYIKGGKIIGEIDAFKI